MLGNFRGVRYARSVGELVRIRVQGQEVMADRDDAILILEGECYVSAGGEWVRVVNDTTSEFESPADFSTPDGTDPG